MDDLSSLHSAEPSPQWPGEVEVLNRAVGGSSTLEWLEPGGYLDRAMDDWDKYLDRVDVLWWYQGESDALAGDVEVYFSRTEEILERIRARFGHVPVILVQLAHCRLPESEYPNARANYRIVAEQQRWFKSHAPHFHVVPAYDLAMRDNLHLNRVGMRELATRVARATRRYVLGSEHVDVKAPQIKRAHRIQAGKNDIQVEFDTDLGPTSDKCGNQFEVYTFDNNNIFVSLPLQNAQKFNQRSILLTPESSQVRAPLYISYGTGRLAPLGGFVRGHVRSASGNVPALRQGFVTVQEPPQIHLEDQA